MTFHSSPESQFASAQGGNCITVSNFVEIGQTAAEIWRFSQIFQDGGRRHLGFAKFQIFKDRTAQEGRNALPFQMWSILVKSRPKYGDFSFKTAATATLSFKIFEILPLGKLKRIKLWTPCQISSKTVRPRQRYGDFSISKIAAAAILDF